MSEGMEKVLLKWAKNEKKLKEENREIKEELSLMKKQPTPEDFDEEYKKKFKEFIKKLKKLNSIAMNENLIKEINKLSGILK